MDINTGKYTDLSSVDYHAHTDSISRSAIMDFAISPRRYFANYLDRRKPFRESTPAMIFGEMFHKLILEPESFEKEYCLSWSSTVAIPEVGLLKNIGREEYKKQKLAFEKAKEEESKSLTEWALKNDGKTSIRHSDFSLAIDMKVALQANEYAWDLLTGGNNEHSYFWKDEDTDLILKARPDALFDTVCVDLKTCKDASPRAFQRAMVDGGYHIQAAMIVDAVKAIDGRTLSSFVNIAIEKEYPHLIGIYILDDAAIDAGREKYKRILKEMKIAKENNKFNDYETQIIGLPGWYE